MAELNEPRIGLSYGWDLGESNWKNGMDENLLKLGAFVGLGVIDRNLTAPPGGESDGDIYIPAATATGAWSGQENNIAIFRTSLAGYQFYAPGAARILVYIEDEAVLSVWNGTNWTSGISLGT